MKIIQVVFKKGLGGVEQCFVDYCEALQIQGHEVHNIIQKKALYKSNLEKINKNIHELNVGCKVNPIMLFMVFWKIKKIKPDIVICHTGKAAMIVKIATWLSKRFPVIGVDHGEKAMNYIKYHKADYVFCVNSWLTSEVNKLGKDKGVIAYNIPNMVKFGNAKLQKRKWHTPISLGILSRISGEKMIHKIIESIALLKKNGFIVNFLIAGRGDLEYEQKCRDTVKELKLSKQVKFLGWVKNKKLFFEKIDIYCMPSAVETFGISYLDAMKYSTPIIACDSWGPSDILKHEYNALVIPSANTEERIKSLPFKIEKEVEKLIKDKVLARYLTINAFNTLKEKYTIEKNSQLINKTLKKVMEDYNK